MSTFTAISGQPQGDSFSNRHLSYFGIRGDAAVQPVGINNPAMNFNPQGAVQNQNAALAGSLGYRGQVTNNTFTGEDVRAQATEIQVVTITRAAMRAELQELMSYVIQVESDTGTIIATRMEMPQNPLHRAGQQTVPREDRMYTEVNRFYGKTFAGILVSDAEANTHERGRQLFQLRFDNLLMRVQVTIVQQVLFSLTSIAKTRSYTEQSIFNDHRSEYDKVMLEGQNIGMGTTDPMKFQQILTMMVQKLQTVNTGQAPIVIALQEDIGNLVDMAIFIRTLGNPDAVTSSPDNFSIPPTIPSYTFGGQPVIGLLDTAAMMQTYAGRTTSSSYSMMRGSKRFGEAAEFREESRDVRYVDNVTVDSGSGIVYNVDDQALLLPNAGEKQMQFVTLSDGCELSRIGMEPRSWSEVRDLFVDIKNHDDTYKREAFGTTGQVGYQFYLDVNGKPQGVYFLGHMHDDNLPSYKLTQVAATVSRHVLSGYSTAQTTNIISVFSTEYERLRNSPSGSETYYFHLARAINARGVSDGGVIVNRNTITNGGSFIKQGDGTWIVDPNAASSAGDFPIPPNLASVRTMAAFSGSQGYGGNTHQAFNSMADLARGADLGVKTHNTENGLLYSLGGDKPHGVYKAYSSYKHGDVFDQLTFNSVPVWFLKGVGPATPDVFGTIADGTFTDGDYKLSGERVTVEEAIMMVSNDVKSCVPSAIVNGKLVPAIGGTVAAYGFNARAHFGGLYAEQTDHIYKMSPNEMEHDDDGVPIPHARGLKPMSKDFINRIDAIVSDETNMFLRAIRAMVLFDNMYYEGMCRDAIRTNTKLPVRPVIVFPRILYDVSNLMLMVPQTVMVAYSNMHAQFASMAKTSRDAFTLRATFTVGVIKQQGVYLWVGAFLRRYVKGGDFSVINGSQTLTSASGSGHQDSIFGVGVASGRSELPPVAPAMGKFDSTIGNKHIEDFGTFPGVREATKRLGIHGLYPVHGGSRAQLPSMLFRSYSASYDVSRIGTRTLKLTEGTSPRRYMASQGSGFSGANIRATRATDMLAEYTQYVMNGKFTTAHLIHG